MKVLNEKMKKEVFLKIREQVLKSWATGKQAKNLQKTIDFHLNLSPSKIYFKKLVEGNQKKLVFVEPRGGVALIEQQIELLRSFEKAGADFLPVTIDSYTRQNRYKEAELAILESKKLKTSVLNGYPAVNEGVDKCRKIIEQISRPADIRHGSPDARLLAEIALAAGFTGFEGGAITYNIPYAKDVSLSCSIFYWQYVDRLVGIFEEKGVIINRESFGPLTGTLVPPFISIVVSILEALLAAEQGVKAISVGYGQGGNLIQDVASIKVLKSLTEKYLREFGYKNILITTVFHQWMGGFPKNEAQAFGIIAWGAITGCLAGANKIISKTPHEAFGIPTKRANLAGIKITKYLINFLKEQKPFLSPKAVDQERKMIQLETDCLLEKILALRKDIAQAIILAFKKGYIDVPFAPSRYNLGKILPARDLNGAIRLLNFGNLPLSKEIIEFHKEKIEQRAKKEKRRPDFQMVINDIYAIAEGKLIGGNTNED